MLISGASQCESDHDYYYGYSDQGYKHQFDDV